MFLTPKRAELMSTIAERVTREGRAFGINVLDVRLRRVDLPEENSQAIFNRMQTQREQEARRIRAEGDKESRRIRAEADKTAQIIVATADRRPRSFAVKAMAARRTSTTRPTGKTGNSSISGCRCRRCGKV